MSKPKVSVIVPVYKAEQFMERAARSLFGQTLDDMEYIFVDDCTPDRSFEVLEQVMREYPHRCRQVRILRQPRNSRQAAARTVGMQAATGEYMIHFDPDDWVEADAYESLYVKAKASGADVVGCRAWRHKAGMVEVCEQTFEGSGLDCLLGGAFGSALWARLISTDLIKENRIYPYEGIDNGEDANVMVRVLLNARKVSSVDRPLYHYNAENEGSMTAGFGPGHLRRFSIPNVELIGRELERIDDPRVESFLDSLKFTQKHPLLHTRGLTYSDLRFWRRLWPESHRYLRKGGNFGHVNRIVLRFALRSTPLLWIYYRLLQFLLKNRG